ncbi:MAG: phosphoribosylformimino-5-aminoimidazole carboxamide ribotide isomerase [Lentisphaeria bacterium]|nr:phosphoribosylformimino-5-aminoimidazole carboxamide ribotide isomerase [Lentisphaeria bacterium]
MGKAQFRPCIDLHDGKVKQIVGGTLTDSGAGPRTNFVAEHTPDHFASLYRRDGLTGGHIIKLGPGNEEAALCALHAWPGGMQIGGGITPENALYYLEQGAESVIVTSCVFADGRLNEENLELLFKRCGREHLVLDLSCRKRDGRYYVVTDRWQKFTSYEVGSDAFAQLGNYCKEFLIHAVDVEGKRSGIDRELLEILSSGSPVDCVYAGGIAGFEDIELVERCGKGKVHYTIGSALDIFGGTLSYADVCRRALQA